MATTDLIQTATVLTNELRLHDWVGAKLSLTFGESNQDGAQSYANLKYKADEETIDFIMDRDTYNIAGPTEITLNDHKIWHEENDGPNSGLNADLLDGRHAVEFKDRYGYHHFLHMFRPATTTTAKQFVHIARFTTRKVGTAQNFTTDGEPPYSGIFEYTSNGVGGVGTDDVVVPGGTFSASDIISGMQIRDSITQFQADTPYALDDYDPDLFHSTNMLTNGVYNGTLRASATLLKADHPTTFDFHIGLFEKPTATEQDSNGWNVIDKYFYVSLHDETLPFLKESDWTLATKNDTHLNDGVFDLTKVNRDTDDKNSDKNASGVIQDGYTGARFPSFPAYAWTDAALSAGTSAVNTDNSDVIDDVIAPIAMANLYFTEPTGEKAKQLQELKRKYGNNATVAIQAEAKRLKDLGLAMADLDGFKMPEGFTTEAADPVDGDGDSTSAADVAAKVAELVAKIEAAKDSYDNERDDINDNLDDVYTTSDSSHLDASVNNETHDRMTTKVDIENGSATYNIGKYGTPVKTEEDAKPYRTNRRRKPFPLANANDQGDSYQQYVDIMRLYHTKSRTDVIDNVTVTTHQYDLYMQVDTEMEVRVQPYMSSACLMYNFKPVIQEADLPQTKFIRPKSIYDNRYASVRHRHYDYERRIWELTLEVDQLWQNFNNYVKIEQGLKNANKIMQTDSKGRIFAAIDNMEKHCEPTTRRIAERVLVTLEAVQQTLEGEIAQATSCIGTSDITTDELYALDGIKGNIQEQLEALRDAIDNVVDAMNDIWKAINALKANLGSAMGDFVKKSGDDMTGSLWMHYDGNTYTGPSDAAESFVGVKFNNATSGSKYGGYLYGATMKTHVGLGVRHPSYIGTDREEDWAVAVTSEIDDSSRGVACQFNGTHLRFTNGGRISDPSSTSFTIDFEKFRDWWHTEIAPNGFGEIDS